MPESRISAVAPAPISSGISTAAARRAAAPSASHFPRSLADTASSSHFPDGPPPALGQRYKKPDRTASREPSRRSLIRWNHCPCEPRANPLLAHDRPGVHRVPRRGVGAAGARRARPLRAFVPRGVPVGPRLDHRPAQARGVPPRVRGLRSRARGAVRRARRRAAARRRGDHPPPRQDRGRDRQRPRDARPARGGDAARRADVGVPRRGRREGALAPVEGRRLPLRRPDDGLLVAARRAASSTATSPTAGCATRSRPSGARPSPRGSSSGARSPCGTAVRRHARGVRRRSPGRRPRRSRSSVCPRPQARARGGRSAAAGPRECAA